LAGGDDVINNLGVVVFKELQLDPKNSSSEALVLPDFLVTIFEGEEEIRPMCTDSAPIFSIEVKSLLRLNFDNLTGPTK
jgi:hypothetical protein